MNIDEVKLKHRYANELRFKGAFLLTFQIKLDKSVTLWHGATTRIPISG